MENTVVEKENLDLTIIILSAGVGSRMKSSIPKAMHLLGGIPMIDHLLNKVMQLNPTQIISVIGSDMDCMQDHIINRCDIIHQEKRLGTAHAVFSVKYAHKSIKGISLVLYADTPLVSLERLQEVISKIEKRDCDICILGFEKLEENSYGKLILEDNKVVAIIEHAEANDLQKQIKLCNSGVIAVRTEILWGLLDKVQCNNSKGEYYLTDIIDIANKDKFICHHIVDELDNLMGANTKQELAILEKTFQDSKRQEFLEQGVQLIDPQSVYFSFDTKIGKDVIIHPNVHILANVEIKDKSVILPFSVIEGAVIGENSKVGPYARLRPETILQGDNHIGNFVEVKKSSIGRGTKINHLSYIGDSMIGQKTNVGAGTITCNYDGKNKHTTTIGDNCFIGSNSALVAPINIGSGVLIGAGSVITKSVEENKMTIARGKQVILPKIIK